MTTDWQIRAHGVWYLDRAGKHLYRLDEDAILGERVPLPERVVAIALLKYALKRLEEQEREHVAVFG